MVKVFQELIFFLHLPRRSQSAALCMIKLVKPAACRKRRLRALAAAAPPPSDAAPAAAPESQKKTSRKASK